MSFEQEKKHHVNKPLIKQLRGLYRNVEGLGGIADGNTYNEGYNAAIDNVLWLLKNAGFEEGKSTAADEIEFLNSERAKAGEKTAMFCGALETLLRDCLRLPYRGEVQS